MPVVGRARRCELAGNASVGDPSPGVVNALTTKAQVDFVNVLTGRVGNRTVQTETGKRRH